MALVDPADLRHAAAPGKIRDLVVSLYERARSNPKKAGSVLSGAQRELRTLRSRQRRWVLDGLYDLIRYERLLRVLTDSEASEALWVGWLVKQGLEPTEAAEASELEVDFRRCASWDESVATELRQRGAVEATALLGSIEPVVASQILSSFGKDGAWDFLEASNRRGPVVLRANRLKCTRKELMQRLQDVAVPCEEGWWNEDAVVLKARANLPALQAFKQGLFEVQDEGSQMLARLVDPEGLVVDLCAGAGGKTLALAAQRPDRLVACDVRESALHELHKRSTRAGARVEVHMLGRRGELPKAVTRLRADRVLVDAPCTGTGVLRRHPEHRWQVDDVRLKRKVALQTEILERAAAIVKPGGRLIYGTCSVLPAENEAVVDAFRERHTDFVLMPASKVLGPEFGAFLHTAPHQHDTDGFFGAVLMRV